MKLLKNQGSDRVIDELRASLITKGGMDAASSGFSLFAYGELRGILDRLSSLRLILPPSDSEALTGSGSDRAYRNRLSSHKLARDFEEWLLKTVKMKSAPGAFPQSTLVVKNTEGMPTQVISGNCPLTTDGLGITPGNQFSLVQSTETPDESKLLAAWFTHQWDSLPASTEGKEVNAGTTERFVCQARAVPDLRAHPPSLVRRPGR